MLEALLYAVIMASPLAIIIYQLCSHMDEQIDRAVHELVDDPRRANERLYEEVVGDGPARRH